MVPVTKVITIGLLINYAIANYEEHQLLLMTIIYISKKSIVRSLRLDRVVSVTFLALFS
jgi:hypothetical protein